MKISEELLEFLKKDKIQQLIANNEFEKVYEQLNESAYLTAEFNQLLYASSINPLDYMNKVPNFFLCWSDINEFTIPDWIKSIGCGAFYDCMSLKKITIPDSVTNIGDNAFYGCENLTNITIPNSVTSIGDRAFHRCKSLTKITIPDSVTSIGYNAFYNCSSLTGITIPNSVISIGDSAFYSCEKLTITCYSERVKELIINSGVDENKIKVI